MIENQTLITVLNRDNGRVGYVIPDLGNLHRNFESQESKNITMEELRKLSYVPGGKYLLENCLVVQNEEALKELFIDVEPEYFYTEEEVKILLTTGTLDEFQDCLDFAPAGVIELIKKLAVDLKIPDLAKRNAILDKTGFDVTAAVMVNEETATIDDDTSNVKQRRAAPINTKNNNNNNNAQARRAATPGYKNVKILNK